MKQEFYENYEQLETIVQKQQNIKGLRISKIIVDKMWTYAFNVTADNVENIYRSTVKNRSISQLISNLELFLAKVKDAQKKVEHYINYFSAEYKVSIDAHSYDEILFVHKDTKRRYKLRTKDDKLILFRVVNLKPRQNTVLIGQQNTLQFWVKLSTYNHLAPMNDIYQDMKSEQQFSLEHYLDEL